MGKHKYKQLADASESLFEELELYLGSNGDNKCIWHGYSLAIMS